MCNRCDDESGKAWSLDSIALVVFFFIALLVTTCVLISNYGDFWALVGDAFAVVGTGVSVLGFLAVYYQLRMSRIDSKHAQDRHEQTMMLHRKNMFLDKQIEVYEAYKKLVGSIIIRGIEPINQKEIQTALDMVADKGYLFDHDPVIFRACSTARMLVHDILRRQDLEEKNDNDPLYESMIDALCLTEEEINEYFTKDLSSEVNSRFKTFIEFVEKQKQESPSD